MASSPEQKPRKGQDIDVRGFVEALLEQEAETFVPTPQVSLEQHLDRMRETFTESMQSLMADALEGCDILLGHIEETWTPGSGHPDVNMEDFAIDLEALDNLEAGEDFSLQKALGWSDELVAHLYTAARELVQDRRFENAISGLTFLTTIKPDVPEFWTALGIANECIGNIEEALDSHRLAIYHSVDLFESYRAFVDCCLRNKQTAEGLEIIELALEESALQKELLALKQELEAKGT